MPRRPHRWGLSRSSVVVVSEVLVCDGTGEPIRQSGHRRPPALSRESVWGTDVLRVPDAQARRRGRFLLVHDAVVATVGGWDGQSASRVIDVLPPLADDSGLGRRLVTGCEHWGTNPAPGSFSA